MKGEGGPSVASNMINWNVVIKQIPKSYYDSAQGKTRKKKNIIEGKERKESNKTWELCLKIKASPRKSAIIFH